MMDKNDKPDKTQPKLPAELTEQAEATEPIDRIDPAEPIDRIDPAEPMERMDPLDLMDRIEPGDPASGASRLVRMIAFSQHGRAVDTVTGSCTKCVTATRCRRCGAR